MNLLYCESVSVRVSESASSRSQSPIFRSPALPSVPSPGRNQQILQMLEHGIPHGEVARRFMVSTCRVGQIAGQAKAKQAREERRTKLREKIRGSDDPERLWPVEDLADALGLREAAKSGLLYHFAQTGKQQVSWRELTDLCSSTPLATGGYRSPTLLRVRGIGRKGLWSVIRSLASLDLGRRCNEEWRTRLVIAEELRGISVATSYSATGAFGTRVSAPATTI